MSFNLVLWESGYLLVGVSLNLVLWQSLIGRASILMPLILIHVVKLGSRAWCVYKEDKHQAWFLKSYPYHMKTIRVEEGKYVEGALVFLLYFPGFCCFLLLGALEAL